MSRVNQRRRIAHLLSDRASDRMFHLAGRSATTRSRELVSLLEWIQSDGLLRTRDQMVTELMTELGFKKRGRLIVAACQRTIDRHIAVADPEGTRRRGQPASMG